MGCEHAEARENVNISETVMCHCECLQMEPDVGLFISLPTRYPIINSIQ